MGRSVQGGVDRAGRRGVRETGQWRTLRARLWRQWTGNGAHSAICYHCQHPITNGLGEIQHLLSPQTHPQSAMLESNLRPSHGGGRKRCGSCGLACNQLAAGNAAARDEKGRPLPFSEAFIRAAQARTGAGNRLNRPVPPVKRAKAPETAGREWL